ncbi:MAG: PEP-CTERM sorting domain-containing protein [Planctomycetota bacterium]
MKNPLITTPAARLLTHTLLATAALTLAAAPAAAITLDGVGLPSEGLTLQATQTTGTGFGNADNGSQGSNGSELNELFADINNGVLELAITGNLESNFNKLFIFFDAVDGGENVLLGDNIDGGFNEIQSLAGLAFPTGVTPDHGLRVEIGGGFAGVNFFDLVTNTATSVVNVGGPGDLPLVDAGGPRGVTVGWDNSNVDGVTDMDVSLASTATTGLEFEIDLAQAFNGSQGDIEIVAFVTNGGGDFLSNQFLPGLGTGVANPGAPGTFMITDTVTVSGPPIDGALLGDIDGDGDVDLVEDILNGDGVSDFDILRMNWLETNDTFGDLLTRGDGDLNEDGEVGIADFREWKDAFNGSPAQIAQAFALLTGQVPEPSTAGLALLAGVLLGGARRRG